jgi:hypothetical protein
MVHSDTSACSNSAIRAEKVHGMQEGWRVGVMLPQQYIQLAWSSGAAFGLQPGRRCSPRQYAARIQMGSRSASRGPVPASGVK